MKHWKRNARGFGVMLVLLGAASFMVGVGAANAGAASGPKRGGNVVVGDWTETLIDPGAPGYNNGAAFGPGDEALGELFSPPAKPGGALVPQLATSYSYNKSGTALTIQLRHGVKFQDGTPFNAAAVVWMQDRLAQPTSNSSTSYAGLKSIKADGTYAVTITFDQPNGDLLYTMAYTQAGEVASPTAYNAMGASAFGTDPVGAGPFKITAVVPGQTVTETRWPGYWDAKHVYLNSVEWENTGSDPATQLNDVKSGSIDTVSFDYQDPTSIIYQAASDPNLKKIEASDTNPFLVVFNNMKAPFNNIVAREAIAYCTNRPVIANSVYQGYANPAYVMAGSDVDFMSGTVDGKSLTGWKFGKALDPYSAYDPAKSEALVKQLGGLTFQFLAPTANVYNTPVVEALMQEWTACGMSVTETQISLADELPAVAQGDYEALAWTNETYQYPATFFVVAYYGGDVNTAQGGFNIPAIQALFVKSEQINNDAQNAALWHKLWHELDVNVELMPVISSPYFNYYNKCLSNMEYYSDGIQWYHAYETCSV